MTDTEKPVAKKAKSSTRMKDAATYRMKYKFVCTICRTEINCSYQGKADFERHIGKSVHQDNVKLSKSQSTINFVSLSNDKVNN